MVALYIEYRLCSHKFALTCVFQCLFYTGSSDHNYKAKRLLYGFLNYFYRLRHLQIRCHWVQRSMQICFIASSVRK